MKRFLFLVVVSLFAHSASAMTSHSTLLGRIGLVQDNFARVSTADSGSTGLMAGPLPALALSMPIASLMPTLTYTPLGRTGAGDTSKARILVFDLPYIWNFTDSFELKTGLGVMFKMISGAGGTVQLNNGTGTSSFARPGRTETSRTLHLQLGAGFKLSEAMRLDLDTWISDALSSRRALSVFLSLGWGFL